VILACEEQQAERMVMALRPRLKEFGGMCLVSDCDWVIGPAVSY
jgi:nitrogen regulatory protein P-II 1